MALLGTVLKFLQVYLFLTGSDIALTQPCLKLDLVWCLPLLLGEHYLTWGKWALGAHRPLPPEAGNFPPPFSCPVPVRSEPRVGKQWGGCTPRATGKLAVAVVYLSGAVECCSPLTKDLTARWVPWEYVFKCSSVARRLRFFSSF